METLEELSLYIHIPFCRKRCGYCDFNTSAGMEHLIPNYVESLIKELSEVSEFFLDKPKAVTLFFGGGTPSIVPIKLYERLFERIHDSFLIQNETEISMEANPGTITLDYLASMRKMGVNRLSLGAQSTNDQELNLLDRIHNRDEVFDSIRNARKANFDNISIDLMYGLPSQEMKNWLKTLEEIKELNPEHISLYALSIENGTPFHEKIKKKELILPDSDTVADMYDCSREKLKRLGYSHYEISNWARRGYECRHNKQYWYSNNYIGIGAGAHSQYDGARYYNEGSLSKYMKVVSQGKTNVVPSVETFPISSVVTEYKIIEIKERMQETMMLGLRLTEEGVSARKFIERFGEDMRQIFENEIYELLNQGLVEWEKDSLKLTQRGQFIGNRAFLKFVQ